MEEKLKFYSVSNSYIKYLSKFDSKVPYNKEGKRTYIGIILEIGELKYYAPLSSPKLKHQNMINSLDFFKIDNGRLGVVNLNNMIPVINSELTYINIRNVDEKYSSLLRKQLVELNSMYTHIVKQSERLRNILLKDDAICNDYELRLKERCCNIILLESIYKNFNK